jgi:hypothetical protein
MKWLGLPIYFTIQRHEQHNGSNFAGFERVPTESCISEVFDGQIGLFVKHYKLRLRFKGIE